MEKDCEKDICAYLVSSVQFSKKKRREEVMSIISHFYESKKKEEGIFV